MDVTILSQPSALDWVLGGVSLASVGVITWQAIMTRRSVRATQDALELAQREQDQNTELIADARRARIDAEMPRLFVDVQQQPGGAFRFDPEARSGTTTSTLDPGTKFTLPRDRDIQIGSTAMVSVSNDGPRRVKLRLFMPRGAEKVSDLLTLGPGESATFPVDRVETLENWVAIYDVFHRQAETFLGAQDQPVLTVLYDFPGAVGAVEEHVVAAGGSIVAPVIGDAGGWYIQSLGEADQYGQHQLVPQPFVRRYRLP